MNAESEKAGSVASLRREVAAFLGRVLLCFCLTPSLRPGTILAAAALGLGLWLAAARSEA
jgi:uncharacterized membrane protein